MRPKPHALPETDAFFEIVTCFLILSPRFIEIVTFANPLSNKDLRNFAQIFKKRINMKRLKAIGLFLGLSCALLWPLQTSAQNGGGVFGYGNKAVEQNDNYGMMGRGTTGSGITNQTYGSDQDGFGITNQTYGDNAPLGSGLLMMTAAAMGYAAMKRNKKQTKK